MDFSDLRSVVLNGAGHAERPETPIISPTDTSESSFTTDLFDTFDLRSNDTISTSTADVDTGGQQARNDAQSEKIRNYKHHVNHNSPIPVLFENETENHPITKTNSSNTQHYGFKRRHWRASSLHYTDKNEVKASGVDFNSVRSIWRNSNVYAAK
eukprot:Ihof_evm1s638 gene=Ihof_evmTU1s638